ncbi:BRAP [Symbiodinium microadriaticum]|nr:BRAP [Symbiodinium microadriaticum]
MLACPRDSEAQPAARSLAAGLAIQSNFAVTHLSASTVLLTERRLWEVLAPDFDSSTSLRIGGKCPSRATLPALGFAASLRGGTWCFVACAAVYKVTEFGSLKGGVVEGEANLAPLPGQEKEQKTVVDVLEVRATKFFRAVGAGAGLEDALPIQRTSALLLLAVPSELTLESLQTFLGADSGLVEGIEAVRVLYRHSRRIGSFSCPSLEGKCAPGSGSSGFYTVILLCRDQAAADALYKANHGRLFTSGQESQSSSAGKALCENVRRGEKKAIVYDFNSGDQMQPNLARADSDETDEHLRNIIPSTAYELPSCPVCIERIDVSGTGMVTHSHGWISDDAQNGRPPTCRACAVIATRPATDRPPKRGLSCTCCPKEEDLWVCLICGHLGCGRYQDAHAKDHATDRRHRFCFQLATGRIWDYECDVFVHRRLVQQAAASGGRYELALPAPAISGEAASSGSKDAASTDEQHLLSMELDAILASQLDYQRSLYEAQLTELHQQHGEIVEGLKEAREAEELRAQNWQAEIEAAEKHKKVLEKQLVTAQRNLTEAQEQLGFVKELNQSLLANRRDMAKGKKGYAESSSRPAKEAAEDPLLLRLREQVIDVCSVDVPALPDTKRRTEADSAFLLSCRAAQAAMDSEVTSRPGWLREEDAALIEEDAERNAEQAERNASMRSLLRKRREEPREEQAAAAPEAFMGVTNAKSVPSRRAVADEGQPPWFVPRPHIDNAVLRLHEEILDFVDFMQHTQEEVHARRRWVQTIKDTCKALWPGCKVSVFGSFFTGLSLPNGDVDVAVTDVACKCTCLSARSLGAITLGHDQCQLPNLSVRPLGICWFIVPQPVQKRRSP